jgi:hypothetical protein
MAVSRVEALMARRQVTAMIERDEVTIIPHRREKISDGAGGWTWGPYEEQDPVVCSIIPAKRRLAQMTENTELGDVTKYPFVVLAHHDADLLRDDWFTWNGDDFQVKFLYVKTEIETFAWVDYYGGEHNG